MAAALTICGCGGETQNAPEAEVKSVSINPLQQVQTVQVGLGDVKRRDIYEGIISPYVEEL